MTPDALQMNRFTLRFAGADAEAAFAAEQARKSVRPARIAMVVLCGLLLAFYTLTIHVFPGAFVGIGGSESQRYTLSACAVFAGFYALTYQPVFQQRQQVVMGILACLIWIGNVRSSAQLPFAVIEARGYTMPLMFTFFVYSVFRLRIVAATLCGWFGTVSYLGYLVGLNLISATGAGRSALILVGANLGGMLICWQMEVAARREFAAMSMLEEERRRAERLLLNILPEPIAERLKQSGESIAEHADGVTVLFADIVGFTPLSSSKSPTELVALLNRVFTEFDTLADANGLEKIKTIGDAYMAVAGLPQARADHAERAARMALAMRDGLARVAVETGEPLALRIGLHSGPVVAGVIGRRKFAYDLWGDTVNTASRMESHGVPGAIHCTEATGTLLRGAFRLEPRGAIEIKGKGEMNTFLLISAEQPPGGPALSAR